MEGKDLIIILLAIGNVYGIITNIHGMRLRRIQDKIITALVEKLDSILKKSKDLEDEYENIIRIETELNGGDIDFEKELNDLFDDEEEK